MSEACKQFGRFHGEKRIKDLVRDGGVYREGAEYNQRGNVSARDSME